MICSCCGTENEKDFRFCIKCGSNLENPQEINYEQVDLGNYHTEEEFDGGNGGFTMNNGTFVIRDSAPIPQKEAPKLYTADELNSSSEEFDFSMYDEPSVPPLNIPVQGVPAVQGSPQIQGMPNIQGNFPVSGMQGVQPVQGINPYMQQPVQGMNPYVPPQIIGYDQSGMPIYGQMQVQGMNPYMQPQIIGYDQSGMPVYGQPQPQIIGYDQSGMPIYGQPPQMMFQQPVMPQTIQGMPAMQGNPQIQGMPNTQMNSPVQGMQGVQSVQGVYGNTAAQTMQGIPTVQGMPQMNGTPPMQDIPPVNQDSEETEKQQQEDFWAFFDGENSGSHRNTDEKDFFGKTHTEPEIPADPFADIDNRRKNRLQQQQDYMNDTPVVDGSELEKYEPGNLSKIYMRQTGNSSNDLTVGTGKHKSGSMAETREVDASLLSSALNVRSRVTMGFTDEANADELEAYVPQHHEALMSQADHAVEAMPKKINPYESELDKIELPEYMQAKKTVKEETAEIPSIPEV